MRVGISKERRSNKDVGQGTIKEGSRFLKKCRILLCCILLSTKEENPSSDKSNLGHERNVIDDVRHQPVIPRSSSAKRSKSCERSYAPPNPSREFIIASSLLRRFTFNDLMLATRNFQYENFLREKGFGTVLKGWVNQHGNYAARPGMGIPVAVKTLNPNIFQGHNEWLAEISYLSEFNHPNLVKLVGFCIEDDKRLLVYEYICRGSLNKHLFKRTIHLTWPDRIKIAIGAANGLAFLHEEASRPIIFRNFKTSNILLDEDYNAKLSNFGLARGVPVEDKSHSSSKVMVKKGYAAPEFVITGNLTSKSDVYSFGVVLLEMLTGRRAVEKRMPREEQNLVEWLRPNLRDKANFHYLMDPRLEGQYPMKGARRAMRLAIHCVRHDPKARPLMSEVVRKLKSLPLHDHDMAGHPSPSTSFQRMHIGPSNHGGANMYGHKTGLASRHFQASPMTQDYPLTPPNPTVRPSSSSYVASSSNSRVGQP